jgi:hypothetical protein
VVARLGFDRLAVPRSGRLGPVSNDWCQVATKAGAFRADELAALAEGPSSAAPADGAPKGPDPDDMAFFYIGI